MLQEVRASHETSKLADQRAEMIMQPEPLNRVCLSLIIINKSHSH